ncbi:MAG: hypothetical protein H6620_06235 [Halobacteriovoraceae bacterium]|nr:hypothetical protein [Halobacteriovoraceae bacterium]
MSQRGSSLIQVIGLTAVMGVISLLMIKKGDQTLKNIKTFYYREEIYSYIQQISNTLMDSDICTNALTGFSPSQGDLPEIKDDKSLVQLTSGTTFGSKGNFKLSRILLDNDTGLSHRTTLKVFVDIDDNIYGSSTIEQGINLFIEQNAGTISNCFHDPIPPGETQGIVEKAIAEFCQGSGAKLENGLCNIKGFTPSLVDTVDCKDPGKVVKNIKETSEGRYEVVCVDNQFYLPKKTSDTCTEDFAMELTAEGKMKCRNVAVNDIGNHFSGNTASGCKQRIKMGENGEKVKTQCP